MEAVLILSIMNLILLIVNVFNYRAVLHELDKTDLDSFKVIQTINVNADSLRDLISFVNRMHKDQEFLKIVAEIHSEALKVRSPLGVIEEKTWPSLKLDETEFFGEEKS